MHFATNMQTRSKSCRSGHRADNEGARPLVRNQAEVGKSATGTDFSQSLDSHQNQDQPNHELPRTTTQVTRKKITRTKWTREEYKKVYLHFTVHLTNHQAEMLLKQLLITGKHTLKIHKSILTAILHPNLFRLANVRRDILN